MLEKLFNECEIELKKIGFSRPLHREQHWRSRVLEYNTEKGGKINAYMTESQISVTFLLNKNFPHNKHNINGDHELIIQCIPLIIEKFGI